MNHSSRPAIDNSHGSRMPQPQCRAPLLTQLSGAADPPGCTLLAHVAVTLRSCRWPASPRYLRYRVNQLVTAASRCFASVVCGAGSMPGSAAKACCMPGMLIRPARSGSRYRWRSSACSRCQGQRRRHRGRAAWRVVEVPGDDQRCGPGMVTPSHRRQRHVGHSGRHAAGHRALLAHSFLPAGPVTGLPAGSDADHRPSRLLGVWPGPELMIPS